MDRHHLGDLDVIREDKIKMDLRKLVMNSKELAQNSIQW
jgi:hypothetical protein